MADITGQWLLSPSGSRAKDPWQDEAVTTDNIEDVFVSDWNDIDNVFAYMQNDARVFGTRCNGQGSQERPPNLDCRTIFRKLLCATHRRKHSREGRIVYPGMDRQIGR